MDTNEMKDMMLDYLSKELSAEQQQILEEMLSKDAAFKMEFEEISATWEQLQSKNTPDPSEKMDVKFYEMLSEYSENEFQKNWFSLNSIVVPIMTFLTQIKKEWFYRLAILIVGLGIGYLVNFGNNNSSTQIVQEDAQKVRETLVLTLLKQPYANKRMQAISETNKFEKVNDIVVEALLKTLNSDDNVNVRLAAIESLLQFADDPFVREGLVKSIIHQESPIVQVTIAKAMVVLQEEGSVKEFKKLLEKEDLNSSVRKELEKSVKSLI